MEVEFSKAERERYAKQWSLPSLGEHGQRQLKQARVLVIGGTAAGTAAASQLASSGVGYLGVVDGAKVALADLAAQAVHYSPDVGTSRAESIAAKLGVLNPEVQIDGYPVDIDSDNAEAIVAGHDLVISADQSREVRLLANGACLAASMILIDCWADGERASVQCVGPGRSACVACVIEEAPEYGAAVPGLAAAGGALAAAVAVKQLAGIDDWSGRRYEVDLARPSACFREERRDDRCPACAPRNSREPEPVQ